MYNEVGGGTRGRGKLGQPGTTPLGQNEGNFTKQNDFNEAFFVMDNVTFCCQNMFCFVAKSVDTELQTCVK